MRKLVARARFLAGAVLLMVMLPLLTLALALTSPAEEQVDFPPMDKGPQP